MKPWLIITILATTLSCTPQRDLQFREITGECISHTAFYRGGAPAGFITGWRLNTGDTVYCLGAYYQLGSIKSFMLLK